MNILQTIRDLLKFTSLRNFNPESTTGTVEELKLLVLNNYNELVTILISDIPGGGGGSQDLQSVLDNNGLASFNSGNQNINIFEGGNEFLIESKNSESVFSKFKLNETEISLYTFGEVENYSTSLEMANGLMSIKQYYNNNITNIVLGVPIANTSISFPSKPEGNYTLATLEDINAVATLEDINAVVGVQIIQTSLANETIIPNGKGVIIVKIAPATLDITLPSVEDREGLIIFFKNSTNDCNIHSVNPNEIWEGNVTMSTFVLAEGTGLRLINDGDHYSNL